MTAGVSPAPCLTAIFVDCSIHDVSRAPGDWAKAGMVPNPRFLKPPDNVPAACVVFCHMMYLRLANVQKKAICWAFF